MEAKLPGLPPDLIQVDRVHDNDVIRTILGEEIGRNNFLAGTCHKPALFPRVDVYDVLYLIANMDHV